MHRFCEQCGEELVGTVNRCWKCGADVDVELLLDIPPIRRAPVDLRSQAGSSCEPAKATSRDLLHTHLLGIRLSERGRHYCAVGSVACGSLACLTGLVSGWSIVLALAGLALGVLGMQARRRDLATMGLVLSVLAIFLGFWQIGSGVWTRYQSRQWLDDLQGIQ